MLRRLFFALLMATLALGAPPVRAGAEANRFAALLAADLRVGAIGLRLFTGAAPRCPQLMPATGLLLHSLAQYGAGGRAEILALRDFPSAVSVAAVIPGSPAERAGLLAGDGIEAINAAALPTAVPPGGSTTALRDAAERQIAALPPAAPIRLTIRRGGALQEIELIPRAACAIRLEVVAGAAIKARSDGALIQLGQTFAERLDDAGIAVALAHELAHAVLGHRALLARLEQGPPSPGQRRQHQALARQFEDDADRLSLELLALACWPPEIAPQFMRQTGTRFDPPLGGGTHRSASDRARRMDRAIPALPPAPAQCLAPGARPAPV